MENKISNHQRMMDRLDKEAKYKHADTVMSIIVNWKNPLRPNIILYSHVRSMHKFHCIEILKRLHMITYTAFEVQTAYYGYEITPTLRFLWLLKRDPMHKILHQRIVADLTANEFKHSMLGAYAI